MTVFVNVACGLRVRPRDQRPSKAAIAEKVHELLRLVQLDWLPTATPPSGSVKLAKAVCVWDGIGEK